MILLFPLQAKAAGCGDYKPAPTKISMQLLLPDPYYDFSHTLKDINRDSKISDDWLSRHGLQKVWASSQMEALGYAEGAGGTVAKIEYDIRKYDDFGMYYCPYVRKMNVAIMFRTRIVIPKEFKQGGCGFNLIQTHELQHYKANKKVIEEFAEKFRHDISQIVKEVENAKPYVTSNEVQDSMKNIQDGIQDAIEVYFKDFANKELTYQNDQIDTPAEYASATVKMQACKD